MPATQTQSELERLRGLISAPQGQENTGGELARQRALLENPPVEPFIPFIREASIGGASLKEQVALQAGRQPLGDPGNFFTKLINETRRPQSATFAGIRGIEQTLLSGGSLSDAIAFGISEANHELTSGEFGQLPRDVQFGDIFDANNPLDPFTGERNAGRTTIGFLGDLAFDPTIVGAKLGLFRGGMGLLSRMGRFAVSAVDEIPVAGPVFNNARQAVLDTFTQQALRFTEGRAARRITKNLQQWELNHLDKRTRVAMEESNALKQLADEAGMTYDEMSALISKHVEETKIGNKGIYRLPTDEERTTTLLNQIERMRLDDATNYNAVRNLAERPILQERPLRRALFRESFEEIEQDLLTQISPETAEHIQDVILMFKDNNLSRQLTESAFRTRAAKQLGSKKLALQLFESAERDYILYNLTQEAKDVLRRYPRLGDTRKWGFELTPQHSSMLQSEFKQKGMSLREINELAREGKLTIGGQAIPERFTLFDEDPVLLDSIRAYYAQSSIERINTLTNFAEIYGRKFVGKEAKLKATQKLAKLEKEGRTGYRRMSLPGFEKFWVHGEAADVIESYWNAANNPEVLNKFGRAIDTIQNKIWKPLTLFPFLEYHSRNLMSNQWQKHLAGMDITTDLPEYAAYAAWALSDDLPENVVSRLMNSAGNLMKKVNGDTITLGGKKFTKGEIREIITDAGITSSGQFGNAELRLGFRDAIKIGQRSGVRNALSVQGNPLVRGGLRLASIIEDADRVALFMWSLHKGKVDKGAKAALLNKRSGMTIDEASDNVFKHLFDYNDLTDSEKAIRRYAAPFYAWSRKNIPLQLEYLVAEPHKFAALTKWKNLIESHERSGEAPDERFVARFVRESFNIRWRQNTEGTYEYFLLDNWIPGAELAEIDSLDGIKKFLVGQLGPIWSEPIQQITDEYLFFERDFVPQNVNFMGIDMPDRLASLLRNVRILTTIDRFTRDTSPGTLPNIRRLMFGINTVKQNMETGSRIYSSRRQEALQLVTTALRDAQERNNIFEVQRLLEQRQLIGNGDIDTIDSWVK